MKTRIITVMTAILLVTGTGHARWLNVNTGRFQTMDSYEGEPTEPQSLHKYAYAHNNPVNRVDPTGRNAYVINGGGYTGHTAIAIDEPSGGVIAFHYFCCCSRRWW